MDRLLGLTLLLALSACNGVKDDDTDIDTDTETDTDTDEGYADEDEDGFTSDVDCNDNDYTINPDADEVCDEVDNNCDGNIDEGFDADNDGFVSAIDCNGDDCNDDDDSIYPGSSEVPYDGVDQDCDGSDLNDVDEDGYIGEAAGGDDCDDTNPDINPGATEVAKDSVDNDCKDGDSLDGDGDGYDDETLGGDDCDDADPAVHPGHVDWYNDGIDSDCDKADADEMKLYDATVSIVGDVAAQDLLGFNVESCDLDGDGREDLIVSAPFSASYQGRVGIFYGSNANIWTADMAITDADAVISGDVSMFFGMGLACGDFDGDGYVDLAIGRGEIDYASTYVSEVEATLFYGNGTAYTGAMTDGDGDARIQRALGVVAEVPSVVSTSFSVMDLDDDGKDELGFSIPAMYTDDEESQFLFLAGGRYTGIVALEKSAGWTFVDDDGDGDANSQAGISMVGDLNGNGTNDLLINQFAFSSDPDATDAPTEGRIAFLDVPKAGIYDVSTTEYGNILGTNNGTIGTMIVGDVDGDMVDDALITAPRYDSDSSTPLQGILYFVSDIASAITAASSLEDMDAMGLATSHMLGADTNSLFGFSIEMLGDLNGDGSAEILIREPFLNETTDTDGNVISSTVEDIIWVLSGAELAKSSTTDLAMKDVRIQEFEYEIENAETGNNLVSGDLDGDGSDDLMISAYAFPDSTDGAARGKVYVYLSTSWGW
jgi:hypothetical protein